MPAYYDITQLIMAGVIGLNIGATLMFVANMIDKRWSGQ